MQTHRHIQTAPVSYGYGEGPLQEEDANVSYRSASNSQPLAPEVPQHFSTQSQLCDVLKDDVASN